MHQRPSRVSGLVFGGIMAALVVIFALVTFLTPLLPIPLVLAYVRFGGRTAGLTAVVAGALAAMFLGPLVALTAVVPFGILPGLMFGYGFRHKLKPVTIGLLVAAVFALAYTVDHVAARYFIFGGRDPFVVAAESELGRAQINRGIDQMEKYVALPANPTAQQKLVADQMRPLLEDYKENPVAVIWAVIPLLLALGVTVASWINYVLIRWVLRRFGHEVPSATPFQDIRVPGWVAWGYMLLAYLGPQIGMGKSIVHAPWWAQLFFNVLPLVALIVTVGGAAIGYGFLRKKQVPTVFTLALLLAGFWLTGGQIFALLAMLDPVFDFRGLGHGWLKQSEDNQ